MTTPETKPQDNPSASAEESAAAAKEAAQQAAEKAKETANQALGAFKSLDRYGQIAIAALLVVILTTVVFKMLSFDVHTDHPVTPTMANEMRDWENKLNGFSYSAFSANLWGKVLFLCALGGAGLLIFGHVSKRRDAWLPLAALGCAVGAVLMLVLLAFTGAPSSDILHYTPYLKPDVDLTLLGFWLPMAAAGTAAWAMAKRIFAA